MHIPLLLCFAPCVAVGKVTERTFLAFAATFGTLASEVTLATVLALASTTTVEGTLSLMNTKKWGGTGYTSGLMG